MEFLEAPRIEARDLYRSFLVGNSKVEVLKGVSLGIEPGEKVFLCGASGAGKTTLLYTLAELERPEAGEVRLGDVSLYGCSRQKRARIRNAAMGYIFQNYFLLPELTALENVTFPAVVGGKDKVARGKELLAKVGLSEREEHLPAELSGGEQQRVAIARALVNDPAVLYADEPTGNLDSQTGRAVMELLLSIVDEAGKTLIVVTHDSSLAALGDRVVQVADGKLVD